jgi:mannose-6-phosphate isomerase
MMGTLPILEFQPIVKELVWGGRRLEKVLGKTLPEHALFGESWELVDLPTDQSVVRNRALEGATLEDLREGHREALLGGAPLLDGRFPLLFKFIDANQTLSVQVHPDEAACRRIGGGARPKTEAWYIIDRLPGAVIYVGLKPGVTQKEFADAVTHHRVETLLHKIKVSRGDFIFLPSGTIHAIGSGVLLAEVQQSSDTTYRVFDWNRVGLDGKPRKLHLEEALESIDFTRSELPEISAPPSGRRGVVSDYFVMEQLDLSNAVAALEGAGPLVLMGVGGHGRVEISADGDLSEIRRGQTRLVPAAISGKVTLTSRGENTLLAVRIP